MFNIEKVLKETPEARIRKLRHKGSGTAYILLEGEENPGAYRSYCALRQIRCRNLPLVYEAAEQGAKWLVLEEYLAGDTLEELLHAGPLPKESTRVRDQIPQAGFCYTYGYFPVDKLL